MSREPDWVVIRVPGAFFIDPFDGRWVDRSHLPAETDAMLLKADCWAFGLSVYATATPTGQFEVREDGAVAEVWTATRCAQPAKTEVPT